MLFDVIEVFEVFGVMVVQSRKLPMCQMHSESVVVVDFVNFVDFGKSSRKKWNFVMNFVDFVVE